MVPPSEIRSTVGSCPVMDWSLKVATLPIVAMVDTGRRARRVIFAPKNSAG